jgi:hypothetical protein
MGKPMLILQTLVAKSASGKNEKPAFYVEEGKVYATCGQGMLRVVQFELGGVAMSAAEFAAKHGSEKFEFNN